MDPLREFVEGVDHTLPNELKSRESRRDGGEEFLILTVI